jgi:MFS family permease
VNPMPMRHLRRNLFLLFCDYLLFGTSFALIGPSNVIPDFVSKLTTSKEIIGFSGSLFHFSWLLPQLLLAQLVNRATRRKRIMAFTAIPVRCSLLLTALFIGTQGADNPNGILITFMAGYSFFAMTDGMLSLIWADILGSSVPPHYRGILFGAGQLAVAVSSLGVRALVGWLLGPTGPAFPHNYALMFGIAALGFIIGGIALTLIIEEQTETPREPGPNLNQYIPYLGNVLRNDREFLKFVIVRILLDLAAIAVPFYVVFARLELNLKSENVVPDAILIGTAGNAIASVLTGWLNRRYGSRAVIRVAGAVSVVHPLLALASVWLGQPALYFAFFVFGFLGAITAPGYFDWIITHAPPNHRPIYTGLSNTITAVSSLSPILAGIILNVTSYSWLFVLSAILGVGSLWMAMLLSEPRQRPQGDTLAVTLPSTS